MRLSLITKDDGLLLGVDVVNACDCSSVCGARILEPGSFTVQTTRQARRYESQITARVKIHESDMRGVLGRHSFVAPQPAELSKSRHSAPPSSSAGTLSGLRLLSSWYSVSRLFSGQYLTCSVCGANRCLLGARMPPTCYYASVADVIII